MTLVLLQMGFKMFKQSKGIRSAASEAGDDLIVIQAAYLAGVAFHHGIAQRNLAITTENHFTVAAY